MYPKFVNSTMSNWVKPKLFKQLSFLQLFVNYLYLKNCHFIRFSKGLCIIKRRFLFVIFIRNFISIWNFIRNFISLFKFSENLTFSAIASFSLRANVRSISSSDIDGDGKGVLNNGKSEGGGGGVLRDLGLLPALSSLFSSSYTILWLKSLNLLNCSAILKSFIEGAVSKCF